MLSVRFTDDDLTRLDRVTARLDALTKVKHTRTDAIRHVLERGFAETERTR
jgi:hypothetical protein